VGKTGDKSYLVPITNYNALIFGQRLNRKRAHLSGTFSGHIFPAHFPGTFSGHIFPAHFPGTFSWHRITILIPGLTVSMESKVKGLGWKGFRSKKLQHNTDSGLEYVGEWVLGV